MLFNIFLIHKKQVLNLSKLILIKSLSAKDNVQKVII